MKKQGFIAIIIAFILGISLNLFLITPVKANMAEPPYATIVVSNAPADLDMNVSFNGTSYELSKTKRGWETYYYIHYYDLLRYFKDYRDVKNLTLEVSSSEKSFSLALPEDSLSQYNNTLYLDINKEVITIGDPVYRKPLLVVFRIVVTLLVEGLIFFLFRYKSKRSWLVFLITNLVTQGFVNISFASLNTGSTYFFFFGYLMMELIVLIVELLSFLFLIKEKKKWYTLIYVVVANSASLTLGALLVQALPV
ncbi:MAG: hypothetical protein WC196_03800 [Bacilli bacterium]|nr:hypothetical protein [Bacilli bacterium]